MIRDLLLLVTLALLGCSPLHADSVDALGPEAPGIGPSEFHRAGQPCLTCHGGDGPGSTDMSVAGTVYETANALTGLAGAEVTLVGADGARWTAVTNRVGNFYVPRATWSPVYPLRTSVAFGGVATPMNTHIGASGSCAGCHRDPVGPSAAGHVYLVADPAMFPGGGR